MPYKVRKSAPAKLIIFKNTIQYKMSEFGRNNSIKLLRILYTIWTLVGIYSIVYVPPISIDFGNGMSTSANISNNELLFRSGIVGRLMTQLLLIIIPLLRYKLFESVNKSQAILMVLLALVSVPLSIQNETVSDNVDLYFERT
jgi:hypothetical protein